MFAMWARTARCLLRQQRRVDGASPRRHRAQFDSTRPRLHRVPGAGRPLQLQGAHERGPVRPKASRDRVAAGRVDVLVGISGLTLRRARSEPVCVSPRGTRPGWKTRSAIGTASPILLCRQELRVSVAPRTATGSRSRGPEAAHLHVATLRTHLVVSRAACGERPAPEPTPWSARIRVSTP